jgi:hypothetical protein
LKKDSRFRLAEQGKQSIIPTLVLGFIVYIVIGLFHDILEVESVKNKEGMSMKTKANVILVACAKYILLSVWTVSTNYLAGTLLA